VPTGDEDQSFEVDLKGIHILDVIGGNSIHRTKPFAVEHKSNRFISSGRIFFLVGYSKVFDRGVLRIALVIYHGIVTANVPA
jgi:hypothetical protein